MHIDNPSDHPQGSLTVGVRTARCRVMLCSSCQRGAISSAVGLMHETPSHAHGLSNKKWWRRLLMLIQPWRRAPVCWRHPVSRELQMLTLPCTASRTRPTSCSLLSIYNYTCIISMWHSLARIAGVACTLATCGGILYLYQTSSRPSPVQYTATAV